MITALLTSLFLAGSPWAPKDTAVETGFLVVLTADMSTTVWNGDRCREANPLLGKCPSRERIAIYGFATFLAHAGIARVLPNPYRRIWQMTWIGIEAGTVGRNYTLGAQFRF